MWRSIFTTALLASASGCVNVVSIDAEDSTDFAQLEASAPLDASGPWRIQLRASTSDGRFSQSLDSGERIEIGDQSIAGPASVAGELDLAYYSIAIGSATSGAKPLTGELRGGYYFGIAITEFDLILDDGTARFDESDGTTELYLQASLDYGINDSFGFGFAWAGSFGSDLSGISEIDLELGLALAGPLRLSLGYRWLEYNYAEKDDESHIEVDFRGPYVALELAFD